MKKLTTSLLAIAFVLATAGTVNAAGTNYGSGYGCQPVYGGGENCVTSGNLLVNKTVQNPSTGAFVDNLSVNDPKYTPSQTINFQISVTNTGNAAISNTTVVDTLPLYVSFVSGAGNFDSKTKKLTFTVTNLQPNETRVFALSGQISGVNSLPSNQSVTCDINQVTATGDNGQTSNDNSQFCIQNNTPAGTTKGGLPIYPVPQKQFTTPATGPEELPMIGIAISAVSGFVLRKKSK